MKTQNIYPIYKVLIADSTDEFRQSLADALSDRFHVKLASSGPQAFSLLESFAPDILILDLMLSGLDGLTLMQDVINRKQVLTLATTRFLSPYILDAAARMGICYLMLKPCHVDAVASRVQDLSDSLLSSLATPPDPRTSVANMLLDLNISTKRRGYTCLREAIVLMAENPSQSITKELYPAIGAAFGSNREQVERVIRTAIEAAWRERDEQVWRGYFTPKADGSIARPTNAAFICRLAACLTMEQDA